MYILRAYLAPPSPPPPAAPLIADSPDPWYPIFFTGKYGAYRHRCRRTVGTLSSRSRVDREKPLRHVFEEHHEQSAAERSRFGQFCKKHRRSLNPGGKREGRPTLLPSSWGRVSLRIFVRVFWGTFFLPSHQRHTSHYHRPWWRPRFPTGESTWHFQVCIFHASDTHIYIYICIVYTPSNLANKGVPMYLVGKTMNNIFFKLFAYSGA